MCATSLLVSDYSRHIAGGNSPWKFQIPLPEIWQRRKFGQLILTRIIEIVAARFQILRLKCTKFDFGWGTAPDPAGELTPLPQTP